MNIEITTSVADRGYHILATVNQEDDVADNALLEGQLSRQEMVQLRDALSELLYLEERGGV